MPRIRLSYYLRSQIEVDVTDEEWSAIDAWVSADNLPCDPNFDKLPPGIDEIESYDLSDGIDEVELTDVELVKPRKPVPADPKLIQAARMIGAFGPIAQGAAFVEMSNDYGRKANETEPCVCGHGKPLHYFANCSLELAEKYKANGYPDGACHLAQAHQKFPAPCGCTMYRKAEVP